VYNTTRPHRALEGRTPQAVYDAGLKATPTHLGAGHYRVRHDIVDGQGRISLRRAGRLHHLAVGYTHRRTPVLALIDTTTVTVIAITTGEILSTHHIDPERGYWRNKNKTPGRWPGTPNMNDDSRHL